jgi:hypothetical protein
VLCSRKLHGAGGMKIITRLVIISLVLGVVYWLVCRLLENAITGLISPFEAETISSEALDSAPDAQA